MFSEGLKPFLEDQMLKRNAYLPIKMLSHNNRAKEARIIGALPGLYSNGRISHIAGECNLLETEMFTFPRGDHDDVLDATTHLAIMLQGLTASNAGKPKIEYGIDWTKR